MWKCVAKCHRRIIQTIRRDAESLSAHTALRSTNKYITSTGVRLKAGNYYAQYSDSPFFMARRESDCKYAEQRLAHPAVSISPRCKSGSWRPLATNRAFADVSPLMTSRVKNHRASTMAFFTIRLRNGANPTEFPPGRELAILSRPRIALGFIAQVGRQSRDSRIDPIRGGARQGAPTVCHRRVPPLAKVFRNFFVRRKGGVRYGQKRAFLRHMGAPLPDPPERVCEQSDPWPAGG